MKTSTQRSIRFDAELYARIEKAAAKQGCSIAELIRLALEQHFRTEQILRDSDVRLRRVCEYAQLALDTIIQEDLPERREGILLEVNNRMERFHGAR